MCSDARKKPYSAGFCGSRQAQSGLRICSDMMLSSLCSFRLRLLSETPKHEISKGIGIFKGLLCHCFYAYKMLRCYIIKLLYYLRKLLIQIQRPDADLVSAHLVAVLQL